MKDKIQTLMTVGNWEGSLTWDCRITGIPRSIPAKTKHHAFLNDVAGPLLSTLPNELCFHVNQFIRDHIYANL